MKRDNCELLQLFLVLVNVIHYYYLMFTSYVMMQRKVCRVTGGELHCVRPGVDNSDR
jgi:hypothetical protein